MARQLRLYRNVQPNKGENTHIIAESVADYVAHFDAVKTIPFNNYRINGNRVLVSRSGSLIDLIASQKITYIIDYDDEEVDYLRCYFVQRVTDESGFIVFEVVLDNWGTYFHSATFNFMHVTRCNRDLANGIYDAVKTTKGATLPIHLMPYDLALSQVTAVFLLEYNVSENLFGGNQITKTSLFGLNLQAIYDLIHGVQPSYDNIDIVQKVIDVIGGIHAVGGSIGGVGKATLSAHVLKMWLVPSNTINYTNLGVQRLVTKCMLTNGADTDINSVYTIGAAHIVTALDMKAALPDPSLWADYLPQYHIEVGTLFRGMPIRRFTKETSVYVHYVYTNSSVNVYIEEGLQQEDITESFEVTITLNNATETALMSATKSIAKIAGGIASVAKGYAKGGYAGAATAASLYGLTMLQGNQPQPLQAIGSGDGALTFSQNSPTSLNNPYFLMLTPSNNDELENAYYFGVQYDLYNKDFADIQTKSLIGLPAASQSKEGTFIQADEMQIEGVNGEAVEYITKELQRGIWFLCL